MSRLRLIVLCLLGLTFIGPSAFAETVKKNPCEFPEHLATTRPAPEEGPTKIYISFYLLDIMSISDIEQTFTADFVMRLKWKDPRLAWKKDEAVAETCRIPLVEVWSPNFLIFNQRLLRKDDAEVVRLESDGTVSYIQRYFGTLASPHYLYNFPRDHNRLRVLIDFTNHVEDLELVLADELMGQEDHFSIHNWKLSQGNPELTQYQLKQYHRPFHRFAYVLVAKRDIDFYFWKVMVLLGLIVCMSWSVFWISPVHRAAQLSMSGAAMLTVITFQLALARILPRISYLTRMDYFILLCTITVFLSLTESVWTSVLAGREREKLAVRVDRISRIVFPSVFVVCIYFIFFA